jgi:hypothetical protein
MKRWTHSHQAMIYNLKTILLNYKSDDFIIFPDFVVTNEITTKIKTFNNLIVYEQIKTINESIKMVQNKNFYFQSLLLKIFSENKMDRLKTVLLYKNILQSRIQKCLHFLRNFNINSPHFL